MADINKSDIKLMQSQRLDDTDQGGGQMTSQVIVDGQVNNLFPDISRLDRVYGRVSMRKAYLAVQTSARETYYGSHTILTEQAADPNVSVCFFSDKDWFDTREEAQDRIESYLVKGPQSQLSLWGDHYKGTGSIIVFTNVDWPVPEIGDVIVMSDSANEQYARVIEVSTELRTFFLETGGEYEKKIITITIGTQLSYDFVGRTVERTWDHTEDETKIYETVAADASRYYGVTGLKEDATLGDLHIRVDDIQANLVPSAASETAVTDAGVGTSESPVVQTSDSVASVSRSIQYNISTNSELYLGEGIKPGTLNWSGGISLTDDSKGNVYYGSDIIGSIAYATGIINFGNVGTYAGTGTITYIPACSIQEFSQTGFIAVETNNRGFVYVYNCSPLPRAGSVKVDYLSGGKWYSIWDIGNGQLKGSDDLIGSGSVNLSSGSISITLGAMPDVGSSIIFYWSKVGQYYDLSGEVLPLSYEFDTEDGAIARNTFYVSWAADLVCAYDDGNGNLLMGHRAIDTDPWTTTSTDAGIILYATGQVRMDPSSDYQLPTALETFNIKYNFGAKLEETFSSPSRDGNGVLSLNLGNTPIIPNTLSVEFNTNIEEYSTEKTTMNITRSVRPISVVRVN